MPSLSQLYRPRRFADVTGQHHVTATLKAELATGSLGHAFLFSGPRGVGKTTCARILAKALGCESLQEGEPCGACAPCIAFQEGRVFDVIEIDAATHTGVDMIREAIIEHVRFAPAGTRKVYILDEAHMLSTASWNALLKTLEEPPAYAFFVFATTEWHKVPPTIVSRCQRFEFRRIQAPAMIERLQGLCEAQGWKAEPAALALLANRSEGCLRDAETLLAQVGALAEAGAITLDTVGLVIPLASMTHALAFLEACRESRPSHQMAETILAWRDAGITFSTLFDDVLEALKRLMMTQDDAAQVALWRAGTEEDARLAALACVWSARELHDKALLLMERRRDIKLGMDPVFITLLAYVAMTQPVETAVAAPVTAVAPLQTTPPTPAPLIVPTKTSTEPVLAPAPMVEQPVVNVPTQPTAIVEEEHVPLPTEPFAAPVVAEAVPVSSADASPSSAPEPTGVLDINTVRRSWGMFLRAVEEINHSLPVVLKISKPERVDGDVLVIRFPYAFHRDKVLADGKHRQMVQECARRVFGAPKLCLDGLVAADEASAEAAAPQDVVGNILNTFGGSVVESA